MSRRRLIVSRRLRGKLTPPSTADIIIAAVVDGGLSVQVIPHQAEELWVWEMDQFGECAGRINQILCDVNCKDDNEMKYFNNLPIVFAIFSSARLLRWCSFPPQTVALCPPNAVQRRLRQCLTYMFIIGTSYLVRLKII